MRWLFILVGALFTVVVLASGAVAAANSLGRVTETQPLAFGSAVRTVVVRVDTGSVHVHGGAEDVSGTRTVDRAMQEPAIDERVEGDTLHLDGHCTAFAIAWCSVSYDLDVPTGTRLDIESRTGRVTVDNSSGDVHAFTGAGQIELTDVRGPLRVETGAGTIRADHLASRTVDASAGAGSVRLQFSAPPDLVKARAGTGSVDVELPADGTSYLVMDTEDGSPPKISVPTDPHSTHVIDASSGTGAARVHHP